MLSIRISNQYFRSMQKYKSIDEHFFDTRGKTADQLEKIYYILGAFYTGYRPIGKDGIQFRSKHKGLAEIVQRELGIGHAIRPNKGNASYLISISHVPYLRQRLEQMGVEEGKGQRAFPNRRVPQIYMSHFVRGIVDNLAVFYLAERKMTVSFARRFLSGMNSILRMLAGVQRGSPNFNQIKYAHEDAARIYKFLYSGLTDNGLYLPHVRDMMERLANVKVANYHTAAREKRIADAMELMRAGNSPKKVAEQLGYSNVNGLTNAFKKVTGMTTREFLMKEGVKIPHHARAKLTEKIEKAKSLFAEGINFEFVVEELGFSSANRLSAAFKKITGRTITEFRAEQRNIRMRRSVSPANVNTYGTPTPPRREYFSD